jgi:hypothetical protein
MYDRLENMEEGKSTPAVISYIAKHLEETVCKPCPEGFTIHGVLLSEHGDKGPNGARGSAQNLSKIGEKSILGHSHAPKIIAGTFQVGTSSKLKLEYNKGPSSWMHTHCILHKNGKRQMINIINGKWHS